MVTIPPVDIKDFDYELPPGRIAQYPLPVRDRSKLLVSKEGQLLEDYFYNIPAYLPDGSLLVYNKTRVVRARLQFRKESGATIELFCLEPMEPTREIQQAFEQTSGVVWKCLVGNSRKWKEGDLKLVLPDANGGMELMARRVSRLDGHSAVEFRWNPAGKSFSEILEAAGRVPLPPYMKRESEAADSERYQTIYARTEGSVAAPTAGLHFTPDVLRKLEQKHIATSEVTLHVGAGTFKPVSGHDVATHEMHTEQIHIPRELVLDLLESPLRPVIAVGTTTMRTLESLYWYGAKHLISKDSDPRLDIGQWDPYQSRFNVGVPLREALEKVLDIMDAHHLDSLSGQTQLMIVPGYRVMVPNILVTNFHMPQSTLLLLVAAIIGDQWKKVYRHALDHDYRFLSYGDACLFFRPDPGF